VTDDDLKELTGCPKLRKLDLNCTGVTGVGLAALARSSLEVITMLGGGSDEGLQVISTIKSLREIHCSVSCTGKTLRALARLKHLRVLNLYGVHDFSAEDLRPLVQLPELRELRLRGIAARRDTMPIVSQMSGLRALDFGADKTVNDEWLACLENLTSLERLNLASTSVTDLGVQRLARLGNLRELDLSALPITDAGLQNLAGLEKLRRIDLSDTRITAKSVAVLAGMRGLREVKVWSDSFSPDAVATLRRMLSDAAVDGRRR
jgi:Leucine-rich repeat (LRR) protein